MNHVDVSAGSRLMNFREQVANFSVKFLSADMAAMERLVILGFTQDLPDALLAWFGEEKTKRMLVDDIKMILN